MATFSRINKPGSKVKVSHIEADGCIVNIYEKLVDRHGRQVTAVEVLPDHYAGEYWKLYGKSHLRIVRMKNQRRSK